MYWCIEITLFNYFQIELLIYRRKGKTKYLVTDTIFTLELRNKSKTKLSNLSLSIAAKMPSPSVAMHWFRKGLRLHDNAALLAAVEIAKQVSALGRQNSNVNV